MFQAVLYVFKIIYIPEAYDNPISRLKRGCPIWILQQDGQTYKVYELSQDCDEETLVEAVKEYIL